MKERPILMSAPMVRACLDGSKTQTRRAIRPQPFAGQTDDEARAFFVECGAMQTDESLTWLLNGAWAAGFIEGVKCPYGTIGERLWVRETWREDSPDDPEGALYRATDTRTMPPGFKWKPSIFMPRWACRLELEIADISIEKLTDISEADAKAEGVEPNWTGPLDQGRNQLGGIGWPGDQWIRYGVSMEAEPAYSARESYESLWDHINGRGAWAANPWVWVVEFKRVRP